MQTKDHIYTNISSVCVQVSYQSYTGGPLWQCPAGGGWRQWEAKSVSAGCLPQHAGSFPDHSA